MIKRRIYSKAPITEAVIDFRVNLETGFNVDDLAKIHDEIKAKYPTKNEQIENEFRVVEIGSKPQAESLVHRHGYRFNSNDGKNILQARLNGFTFSRLTPYDRWEPFRDEAKRLWAIYQKHAKPVIATRVAVRFINRFDFPGSSVEFSDYLTIFPQTPSDLHLNALIMQVQIPQPDLKGLLVVNEALAPPAKPGVVSIVLDFDLFSMQAWNVGDSSIWDFLEKLHDRKNEIFESSITDKTRGIIA